MVYLAIHPTLIGSQLTILCGLLEKFAQNSIGNDEQRTCNQTLRPRSGTNIVEDRFLWMGCKPSGRIFVTSDWVKIPSRVLGVITATFTGPRRKSLFPKAARPAAPCATYCYHAITA